MAITDFGRRADGRAVGVATLQAGALSARILTHGAVLQDLRLAGIDRSLTLGSDRIADYEGPMRFHGSLVGPVANRIAGAQATIAGRTFRFQAGDHGVTLHSGDTGLHLALWDVAQVTADSLTLAIDLPDGLGGFPGNRRITAQWQVIPPATLRLTLRMTTDAPTLANIANHSYWNLDGTEGWAGHALRIAADRWLPSTPENLPTGQIADVAGTAMDFRTMRPITPGAPPLDTCFCLSDARAPLRDVLWLRGASGVTMTVATTEPGIQVFDARTARRPGHSPFEGLAIEPQFWPDAPGNPAFPSIVLLPGQPWEQVSEWR
ncbi:MAG TPA: aldose epimerase family protein, partial [Paracoccaceae bacterium]|nr:aldose epimerase family protein [Paracoccaceae bacterium]